MGRLANSWRLVKASAAVLAADKELLVFPVVSSIAMLLVTATFAVPAHMAGMFQQAAPEGGGATPAHYVVLFLFYLCQYAVIFYFNTALVGAALIRLGGGDPTAADGFRIANRHLTDILGYSVIAATVGLVLKVLADRGGRLGSMVGRLGGLGWSLATYLVVPVLVAEEVHPWEAIQRSARLLKKTWGEQMAGGIGMGLVFGLAILATVVLGVVALIAAASTQIVALIVAVAVAMVLILVGLGLVHGALAGIYTAAVYRYAMGEDVERFYPREVVANAFRSI